MGHKLTKTQASILEKIDASRSGYFDIEWGVLQWGGPRGPYNRRELGAAIKLRDAGLVTIERLDHHVEYRRGKANHLYSTRVRRAPGVK